MPALLTRMSKPPRVSAVAATASSQLASSVTSSFTKPVLTSARTNSLCGGTTLVFENVADHH